MIENFFKTAWRNIWKSKVFSFITIIGLTTGFSCCLLIYLFVQHELSYDRFNRNAENIYRLTSESVGTKGKTALAVTPAPWGPAMKKDFPEIDNYVRLLKDEKSTVGENGKQQFNENELLFADPTFFKIFSYAMVAGDAVHPLDAPNTVIMTKQAAARYFGLENPLGK